MASLRLGGEVRGRGSLDGWARNGRGVAAEGSRPGARGVVVSGRRSGESRRQEIMGPGKLGTELKGSTTNSCSFAL